MGPQRWKMVSLRGVLSPQGYLTVCPLILHIDFAGFLYQGLCRQIVPVLKKLIASGFEGMVPPQAPAHPPTTLPLATRNLLAAPWLLSLPLLFSWLGVPFHFLHSATRILLPSELGSDVSSSRSFPCLLGCAAQGSLGAPLRFPHYSTEHTVVTT